jgi:hypothetical protein
MVVGENTNNGKRTARDLLKAVISIYKIAFKKFQAIWGFHKQMSKLILTATVL